MNDSRSLQEIVVAHPVPWTPGTLPGFYNRQALIRVLDRAGNEVPLFTILRVVKLVTDKIATQEAPAA